MATSTYPLFVPPPELSSTAPKDWSAKQAHRYLQWLTGVLEERTNQLLMYTAESYPERIDEVEPLLARVGAKAVDTLRAPDFSTSAQTGPQLTDRGYALAADLGLLVARLLLDHSNGSEKWAVLRRPKSDVFYNHPVLVGFRPVPLEPIGGSVAEANAVLRGTRNADAWQKIFSHWRAQTSVEAGGELEE